MSAAARRAEAFRALHHGRRPLLLPNAWDVASARLFEEAGFPAVATSSAGVMVSHGYPDGETMPRRDLVAAVARIARLISVPLSADIVSGYGRSVAAVVATVRSMLRAGAVGVNLEDLLPSGRGLYPLSAQVQKLRAIRRLGTSMGIPLVINARTDAFRHAAGSERERFREAVRRSVAFREAGADCVYPMGLTDAARIGAFVEEVGGPVNVMVRPGLPPVKALARLGVKRISFGPAASYATLGFLKRASREIRERGTFRLLVEGALTYDELNALARPGGSRPG
ncbi:MAG TPA: isocitrate lyase/phosphoenolpyruvate mutase family protein [Thermoplasmata archaeon]|nr:isocitrate lyase/phosphoenolpyruvate mutase family protein [Thermoplasmata archaeon]